MHEQCFYIVDANLTKDKEMTQYNFDDSNIKWQQLGDFKHFVVSVLDIDVENNTIDALFKFDPHQQIVLHRHVALNKTFVVQGEHRLYEPNGELKEVRPVGMYKTCPADINPHRECGGDNGAVVLFSMRGSNGPLYEILDDDGNIVGELTKDDAIALYEAGQ